MTATNGQVSKDLVEFLVSAELTQYRDLIETKLKVTSVSQLRYVEDDDLVDLGMSRPEIRRLRRFYKRECPSGAFVKFKKMLGSKSIASEPSHISTSPRHPPPSTPQLPLSRRLISETKISLLRILGKGEFSIVQQGVWTKDSGEQVQVAVKCVMKESLKSETSSFLREAEVMQSLDHQNVVKLFGVVVTNDNVMMITELAPMRSLHECLVEPSLRSIFTLSHISMLVQQIVDAMVYLEQLGYVHRDLATRNILMFSKDYVKVSDFGLSRAIGIGSDYYKADPDSSLKLAIAWCAPECINYLKFTSASDVWSFGVVLWEIFSFGLQPWKGLSGIQVLEMIDEPNCKRLQCPDFCPDDWYQVMFDTWKHVPDHRPKFSQLLVNIPQIKPAKVVITSESVYIGDEYLRHESNDIVTILSRHPITSPRPGLWRGFIESTSQLGYFDPSLSTPYLEITGLNGVQSTFVRKSKQVGRAESARSSVRSSRRLTPAMISGPKDDVRHLGHVGYDGVMFGDVGFIADSYDKIKTRGDEDNMRSSCISLPLESLKRGQEYPYSLSVSSSTLVSNAKFDEFEEADLDFGESLMDEVLGELTLKRESDSNDDFQNLIAGIQSLARKDLDMHTNGFDRSLNKNTSNEPVPQIVNQNGNKTNKENNGNSNSSVNRHNSFTSSQNSSSMNGSSFDSKNLLSNSSYTSTNQTAATSLPKTSNAADNMIQSRQLEANKDFKVPFRPPTHPKTFSSDALKIKIDSTIKTPENTLNVNKSNEQSKLDVDSRKIENSINGSGNNGYAALPVNGVGKMNGSLTNGKAKLDITFATQLSDISLDNDLVRTSMDAGSIFDSSSPSSSTKDVFEDYQGLDTSDISDDVSADSVEISKRKKKKVPTATLR